MKTARHALLAALLLTACKSTPDSTATSHSASPPAASAPPNAAASVAANTASSSSASPPATSASAAPAASPCPAGARKDDDARYCITLPEKRLAVSYEGDSPDQGIREELEISGDRVVIAVGPAKGQTAASMKKAALARLGSSLVESGDLPNGYWTDAKNKEGDGHMVEGVVVSKYVITCTYWAPDESKVEAAREVCGSLRTY